MLTNGSLRAKKILSEQTAKHAQHDLTVMSMLRSPSRLKFSLHKSREFMRALVAAKRVASGRPDLIPSTMAVST